MTDNPKEYARWEEPFETALHLLSREVATLEQIEAAVAVLRKTRPLLGKLALNEGKLTMPQVFRILEEQAMTKEYFGEIAVRLGYLDEATLNELLRMQRECSPTLADVLVEQGVISPEQKADLSPTFMTRRTNSERPLSPPSASSAI